MNKKKLIALSLLSGILLSPGWYEWGSGLFLLTGFIPLLFVEEFVSADNHLKRTKGKVYLYASLSILTWNIITTWWIKNASFAGLLAATFVTTGYMSLSFLFYTIIKGKFGRYIGYISLVFFWIALEFGYTHGEISWPWLTLGNGFLYDNRLIQWYEITGVFGGSLWILTVNILIFEFIRRLYAGMQVRRNYSLIIAILMVVCVPVTYSLLRYNSYKEIEDSREIVVVQPNIDPYMKFNDISSEEQTRIQINLAEEKITSGTDYVVTPETSIYSDIWIGRFNRSPELGMIKSFVNRNKRIKYVVGIWCEELYPEGIKTATSRPYGNTGLFFDTHNSAIQIDTTPEIPIYHKSKLVVGVEKMPYPKLLGILESLTLKLGGTFRSHAIQEERSVFESPGDRVKVAPVICYESAYGEFVGEYIEKGANIIFVITNDGWWGNTPGHRQHNALSRIRAIETRRSIARSANTGISCFINQRGDVMEELTWWKRGAIKADLNLNDKITYYTKHGDYIGKICFILAWVILFFNILYSLSGRLKIKRSQSA